MVSTSRTTCSAPAAARLAENGFRYVSLDVLSDNAAARAVWERLGFREVQRTMVTELETLVARVAEVERPPSFGSIHVQTDDERSVGRAVEQFVPRLGRSGGTAITEARNGWIVVYDELCDRDRAAQRRLAGELSERLAATWWPYSWARICSRGTPDVGGTTVGTYSVRRYG